MGNNSILLHYRAIKKARHFYDGDKIQKRCPIIDRCCRLYTPELGTEKTAQFKQGLEEKIKAITAEYKGEFIKTIGDGLLIFFTNEEKFLDFVFQLRDLSWYRQLDHGEFFADLRMVAHMKNFSFEFFQDKINDLNGPGGIKVFRIEKYAINTSW